MTPAQHTEETSKLWKEPRGGLGNRASGTGEQPCKGPEAGEGLVGLRVSNGGHVDGPLMGSGSHSEREGGQEGSKSRTDVI